MGNQKDAVAVSRQLKFKTVAIGTGTEKMFKESQSFCLDFFFPK